MRLNVKIALLALVGVTLATTSPTAAVPQQIVTSPAPTTAPPQPKVGMSPPVLKAGMAPPVPKVGMAPPGPMAGVALPTTAPQQGAPAQTVTTHVVPAKQDLTQADLEKAKAGLNPVIAAQRPAQQSTSVPSASEIEKAKAGLRSVGFAHLENKQLKPSEDTNPIVNPKLLAERIKSLKKVPKSPLELHKEEMEQKKKAEEEAKAKAEAAAKAAQEAKASAAKPVVNEVKPVADYKQIVVASVAPAASPTVVAPAAGPKVKVPASVAAGTVAPAASTPVPTQTTSQTTAQATVQAPTKTEQGSLKPKEVYRHEHFHEHIHYIRAQ